MDTNNALMLDKELNYEEDGDILFAAKPRVLVIGKIRRSQEWTVGSPYELGRMDALNHRLCIPEDYHLDTESQIEYARGHYSVRPSLLSASLCRSLDWKEGYFAYQDGAKAHDNDSKDFCEGWLIAQEHFEQLNGVTCGRRIETVQDVDYE